MFASLDTTPAEAEIEDSFDDTASVGRGPLSAKDSVLRRYSQVRAGLRDCMSIASSAGFDVIHCLYLDRNEVATRRAITRAARRHAWDFFATLFWPYFVGASAREAGLVRSVYYRLNRSSLGYLLRRDLLDGLFVHSSRIRESLLSEMPHGVRPEKVIEVPDPSELSEPISQEAARRQLSLPLGVPIALFFGTLRWDKGPDLFLEAMGQVRSGLIGVIAGAPGRVEVSQLEKLRLSLPDPDRLILRPSWIPPHLMGAYFAAADIVVLPYRRIFRGTSGVLQRAAAHGKPALVADVGEIGMTVRAENLGVVVEPESPSAIAAALEDFASRQSELTKEVGAAARDYVRRSDWRILGMRVREAYVASKGRRN